jgi:hypothetical protein
MKWSVSSAKMFLQCPKKWYFQTVFAHSKSSNPERKEAYFLKHLHSIYSWRGRLVDQVITRHIVPKMNKHERINLDEILQFASRLMESQLNFAKAKLYRNPSNKPNSYDYCALVELEDSHSLSDESIQQISKEVRDSLNNLFNSSLFSEIANANSYRLAQRALQFRFADMAIRCTPDLIVLSNDKPATIIDWKTESLQNKEHWLQLGIYGVALSRISPHKDFPPKACVNLTDPTRMRLIEFQLLRNQQIDYTLTNEDVTNIEDYIYTSCVSMQQMTNNGKTPEQLIDTLPKTRSPEVCMKCKFEKICWRGR